MLGLTPTILLCLTIAFASVEAEGESRDRRLADGKPLPAHSRPYLVSISYKNDFTGKYVPACGGTVLDKSWILTAAHCMPPGITTRDMLVTAGEHDNTKASAREQKRMVAQAAKHPKHTMGAGGAVNDVMLLRLAKPLAVGGNTGVGTIGLNVNSRCPAVGDKCLVMGWGETSHFGPPSNVPLQAMTTIKDIGVCTSKLKAKGLSSSTQMCGDKTCQGDSGGPVICQCRGWRGTKLVHAGIVSFGKLCGANDMPSVFARTTAYVSWITTCMASGGKRCG